MLGKLLSGAQYHLKTVHLFSRADYLTVIPTVRPFFERIPGRSLLILMDHLGIICNRSITQYGKIGSCDKQPLGIFPSPPNRPLQSVFRKRGQVGQTLASSALWESQR